jgi:hypothetical protein
MSKTDGAEQVQFANPFSLRTSTLILYRRAHLRTIDIIKARSIREFYGSTIVPETLESLRTCSFRRRKDNKVSTRFRSSSFTAPLSLSLSLLILLVRQHDPILAAKTTHLPQDHPSHPHTHKQTHLTPVQLKARHHQTICLTSIYLQHPAPAPARPHLSIQSRTDTPIIQDTQISTSTRPKSSSHPPQPKNRACSTAFVAPDPAIQATRRHVRSRTTARDQSLVLPKKGTGAASLHHIAYRVFRLGVPGRRVRGGTGRVRVRGMSWSMG